ncbi:MAG: Ig-like domain-containing protein, partial [Planctomycetota bacterium]
VAAAALLAAQFAAGATHYVSLGATGAGTGASWQDAWPELDRINWSVVRPGDTVWLDGGPSGMKYRATLAPAASGVEGSPITIARSLEAGHNGRVLIAGDGDGNPLPAIGQSYSGAGRNYSDLGIRFSSSSSWIVIDGGDWAGIQIYGMRGQAGVWWPDSASGSHHITLRFLDVFDCGYPDANEGKSIKLGDSAHHLTFEYLFLHDSMQDVVQGRGCDDVVWRRCWLYNSRPKYNQMNEVWNAGRHHDLIQIHHGGRFYNWTIEDCIMGPNFNQAVFPSETSDGGTFVINMDVRNTLFIGSGSGAETHPVMDKTNYAENKNWNFTNSIFYTPWNSNSGTGLWLDGYGHDVHGCIFVSSNNRADGTPTNSNCLNWNCWGSYILGTNGNPNFVDTTFAHVGTDPGDWPDPVTTFGHDWDFTPQNSICGYGDGSAPTIGVDRTMVTLDAFLAAAKTTGTEPPPPPPPPPPAGNQAPTCSLGTPADGTMFDSEDGLTATATASDPDGTVAKVELLLDDAVVDVDSSAPYELALATVTAGSHSLAVRATDAEGLAATSAAVTVHGVPLLDGLSWEAEATLVIAPFAASGGTVSQASETLDPASGGMALWRFIVPEGGEYVVKAIVVAPAANANSLFVSVDAPPSGSADVWDIALTTGAEERTASWRGVGTPDAPELDPKVF